MWMLEMRSEGQTRRLTVNRSERGWQMTEEQDAHVVRDVTYTDWHRVERAIKVFERAADPVSSDA